MPCVVLVRNNIDRKQVASGFSRGMGVTILLRLPLIFLCISHLVICLHAAPATRLGRLIPRTQDLPNPLNNHMIAKEGIWEGHKNDEVMGADLNDYPGSGANNRHTPLRPPFGRCVEC